MTQNAHDLSNSEPTVHRILNEREIMQIIEEGRSRATELVPKAIRAVEFDLDKNNGRIGLSLLAGVGVLKSGGVTVHVAVANPESWYQRHYRPQQTRNAESHEIPPKE